jgi:hypothetical protein
MKKVLLVAGFVVIGLLVFVGVSVGYAQTTTPPNSQQDFEDQSSRPSKEGGFFGYRPGKMGHMGGQYDSEGGHGPIHDAMIQSMSQALGIDPIELENRLDSGETMYAIAESLGFSSEEFRELMLAARTNAIEQAVADGLITKEMANWMLERMDSMWSNGYGPGSGDCPGHEAGGFRGNRGRGGMRFSTNTP